MKKIISMVLALVMVLSMLPAAAAEGLLSGTENDAPGVRAAEASMSPGWFKAQLTPAGGTQALTIDVDNGSGTWSIPDSGYRITSHSPWTGPNLTGTDGDWWDELGYLPSVLYPAISDTMGVGYGISMATVTTTPEDGTPPKTARIRRWGVTNEGDGEHLWISTTASESGKVTLPGALDEANQPYITLHYTALEYKVEYQIFKDGADAASMLDEVFGVNRPTVTSGRLVNFTVEIPKGTYGTVSVNTDGTGTGYAELYPTPTSSGDTPYGRFPLGKDVSYDTNGSPTGGPGYFSLTGNYKTTAEATGKVTVKLVLETRDGDEFEQHLGPIKDEDKADPDKGAIKVTSNKTTPSESEGYTWEFTFEVQPYSSPSGSNLYYTAHALAGLSINGEYVEVPFLTPPKEWETNAAADHGSTSGCPHKDEKQLDSSLTTTLSTGEKVTVTLEKMKSDGHKQNSTYFWDYGCNCTYYYRVKVERAFRNLTVTGEQRVRAKEGVVSVTYVTLEQETGKSIENVEVALYYNGQWRPIAPGGKAMVSIADTPQTGLFVYGSGTTVEGVSDSNQNIRLSLPKGYAWPNSDRKDQLTTPSITLKAQDRQGVEQLNKTVNLSRGNDGSYYGALNTTSETENLNTIWNSSITLNQPKALRIQYKVAYLGQVGKQFLTEEGLKPDEDSNASVSDLPSDDTSYYNYKGNSNNGSFTVGQGPTATSSKKVYDFKYWVLTDENGKPVTVDGKPINNDNDTTEWYILEPGNIRTLDELLKYTWNFGDFDAATETTESVHTIHLTAVWDQSDPFAYYFTFNSNAYPEVKARNSASQCDQFFGDDINDGNDKNIKKGKKYTMTDLGAAVTVDLPKTDILKWFGEDSDPTNDWFAIAPEQRSTWSNVQNGQELGINFVDTLGYLVVENIMDAKEDSEVKYTVKFTLPGDNLDTAGDETKFFETYGMVKGAGDESTYYFGDNNLIQKGEDGSYTATLEFDKKTGLSTPTRYRFVLPEGTTYEIRMVEQEGYELSGVTGSATKLEGAPDGVNTGENGSEAKEGSDTVGWNGNGIAAYVDQTIKPTTKGLYTVVLKQRYGVTGLPDNAEKDPGNKINVQNFTYLSYEVQAKNYTASAPDSDVSVAIGVTSEISGAATPRFLHVVAIGYIDANNTPQVVPVDIPETDPNDRNVDGDFSKNGVSFHWEYNRTSHKMIFTNFNSSNGLPSGGETPRLLVRTTVPAVTTPTVFTGTAQLQGTVSGVPGELATSEPVMATAFAAWLRVLTYVGSNDNADAAEWKSKAAIPVTIKIKPVGTEADVTSRKTDIDANGISYMLFTSDDQYGLTGGTQYVAHKSGAGPSTGTDVQKNNTLTYDTDSETYSFQIDDLGHGKRVVVYGLEDGDEYEVVYDKDTNPLKVGNSPLPCAVYTNFEEAHDKKDEQGNLTSGKDDSVKVSGEIHAPKELPSTDTEGQPIPEGGNTDMAIFRFVPVHDVKISKEVIGSEPEDGSGFAFKVDLDIVGEFTLNREDRQKLYLDADSTHYHNETYTRDESGAHVIYQYEDNFSLPTADNKYEYTLQNIPDGSTYTVTENEGSADGYVTAYEVWKTPTINADGVISGSSEVAGERTFDRRYTSPEGGLFRAHEEVKFTNSNGTGSVTITNRVSSTAPDADQIEFGLRVTITPPEGYPDPEKARFGYSGAATGSIPAGIPDRIDLKGGQSITFSDLPVFATVKVEPIEDDDSDFTAVVAPPDGTVTIERENDSKNITVTQIRVACGLTIKVEKTIDAESGVTPPDATFSFTLAADAGNPVGAPLVAPASETITITGSGTDSFRIIFSEDGTYKFTVTEEPGSADGYTYADTPVTIEVTVAAAASRDMEITGVTVNGESVTVGTTVTAKFTNQYIAPAAPQGPAPAPAPSQSGNSFTFDSGSTSYPPAVSGTSNGSVFVSPSNPHQGDVVTVNPVPNAGYDVDSVTAKDNFNRAVEVKDNGDGTYSFVQPAGRVTLTVTFAPATGASAPVFSDVPSGAYFADAVAWATQNGVTQGMGDGTFGSDLGCTRAQFVTFLWRAAGSPAVNGAENSFNDVSATAHASYYNAILWAAEQGITAGMGDGTFAPDAVVNRAQSVTFMHRYAQKAGVATRTGNASFDDIANEGAMTSYYDAIGWAVANGITNGNSTNANTFGPMDSCNRGMMITFLYRLFMGAGV